MKKKRGTKLLGELSRGKRGLLDGEKRPIFLRQQQFAIENKKQKF